MLATRWPHIEVDDLGVPRIQGTTTKIMELVVEQSAYGWDVRELQRQHPELSLSQVHAALGYYHEHQGACDQQLAQALAEADAICAAAENPALLTKLRSQAVL